MQKTYWQNPVEQTLAELKSSPEGLTNSEAQSRLGQYGPNLLNPPRRFRTILLFMSQFKSPLILLLIGAAVLSLFLGGYTDASIILAIVMLSGLLGFFQERGAMNALEKLLHLIEIKATLLRDGKENEIPLEQIVPTECSWCRRRATQTPRGGCRSASETPG